MPRANRTRLVAFVAFSGSFTSGIFRGSLGAKIWLAVGIASIGGNTDFTIECQTVDGTWYTLVTGTATSTAGLLLSATLTSPVYRVNQAAPAAGTIDYDADIIIEDPSDPSL